MLTAFRSLTLLGWLALLAFAAFVALALLASPARADDGALLLDPFSALLARLAGPAAAVWGAVLFARGAFPGIFRPGDEQAPRWWSARRAKWACKALALALGVAAGALRVAPDIGDAGLVGHLVGGVLVASLAVYGRDFLRDGAGAVRGQA